jgi:hypothetical protein
MTDVKKSIDKSVAMLELEYQDYAIAKDFEHFIKSQEHIESDYWDVVSKKWQYSWSDLGNGVLAAFGNDTAISQVKSNIREQALLNPTVGDWDNPETSFGEWAGVAVSGQAANSIVFLGNMAATIASGGTYSLAIATGSAMIGVTSGGQKYAQLEVQQEAGVDAMQDLELLKARFNAGYISHAEYRDKSEQLVGNIISFGNMTETEKMQSAVATGSIEAIFTYGFGRLGHGSMANYRNALALLTERSASKEILKYNGWVAAGEILKGTGKSGIHGNH